MKNRAYPLLWACLFACSILLLVIAASATPIASPVVAHASEQSSGVFAATTTTTPTLSVTVNITPAKYIVQVGETITVAVNITNNSIGCQYPVYDITLSEQHSGSPLFRFDSPAKLGPPAPVTAVYTLTALMTGTTVLRAQAYGEQNCGNGFQWHYENSDSYPIEIVAVPPPFSSTIAITLSKTRLGISETLHLTASLTNHNPLYRYNISTFRLYQVQAITASLHTDSYSSISTTLSFTWFITLTANLTSTVRFVAAVEGQMCTIQDEPPQCTPWDTQSLPSPAIQIGTPPIYRSFIGPIVLGGSS